MIQFLCDRAECPSRVEQATTYSTEWLVVAPLDGLLPEKYFCSLSCLLLGMAQHDVPETMPHG
jgi:hypothetical protein